MIKYTQVHFHVNEFHSRWVLLSLNYKIFSRFHGELGQTAHDEWQLRCGVNTPGPVERFWLILLSLSWVSHPVTFPFVWVELLQAPLYTYNTTGFILHAYISAAIVAVPFIPFSYSLIQLKPQTPLKIPRGGEGGIASDFSALDTFASDGIP